VLVPCLPRWITESEQTVPEVSNPSDQARKTEWQSRW
jgi:hypothetical protein